MSNKLLPKLVKNHKITTKIQLLTIGVTQTSYIVSPDKKGIRITFFIFLHKNICCGYSLEVHQGGASNEYPQHIFYGEIGKISINFGRKKCLIRNSEYRIWKRTLKIGPSTTTLTVTVKSSERIQSITSHDFDTLPLSLPKCNRGVILEGDLGEKISLSWLTSPYLELREKWKCIECIGKSKIWTKTSPWNPEIVAKLLPLWKL